MKTAISPRVSWPRGIARPEVRGFRASISASISRLAAIPKVRAPAMARVIHTKFAAPGTPPSRGKESGRRTGERRLFAQSGWTLRTVRPFATGILQPGSLACTENVLVFR